MIGSNNPRTRRAGVAATAQLRESFSKALRLARDRRGLTQADVAGAVGMATEVYGRMERGGMLPSLATFLMLCDALECSPHMLVGKEGLPEVRGPSKAMRRMASTLEDSQDMRQLLRSLLNATPSQVRLIRLLASGLVFPENRKA